MAQASQGDQDGVTQPRRRRRGSRRRPVSAGLLTFVLGLVFAGIAGLALMAVTGRTIPVPGWAVARAEARINSALAGQGSVTIGGADLVVEEEGWAPRVRFRDVALRSVRGVAVAALPDVRVTLSSRALFWGRFEPVQLRVIGAHITARRTATGAVTLDLGAGAAAPFRGPGSMADVMNSIDAAFALPALASIARVQAEGLSVALEDARAGRVWRIEAGQLLATQTARDMAIELSLEWPHAGGGASRAQMRAQSAKGSQQASFSIGLRDVPAADLASQSPALTWLGPLEAPISGELAGEINASGFSAPLRGSLDIGAGLLRPGGVARPIEVEKGRVEFAFDPVRGRVDFSKLVLDSRALRLQADGHVDLANMVAGLPGSLIAQMRFSDVAVDPAGLFAEPVRFSQGAVDLRLRLQPFRLDVGQLVLEEDGRRIEGRGRIGAGPAGWDVALDLALNRISHDRLLALWPVGVVPLTRQWLAQNVQTSQLFDVKAGLRLSPGVEAKLALGYEFSDTDVRFVKTLPPIRSATGYAEIVGSQFVLVVDKGTVTPPLGGPIAMAGSVFRVPDIRVMPALAEIDLMTDSSITAALSLLDEPPFRFMTKAGQPVDAATGRAQVSGRITLPLAGRLMPGDVAFDLAGTLTGVASDRLIPGRVLTAPALALQADAQGMAISGKALVDGVPFDGRWSQGFGAEAAGRSGIEGLVTLSPQFLQAFRIGLPAGAVSGSGIGQLTLDLVRGVAPAFVLQSDLVGLGLRIPEIGWTKPPAAKGALQVEGTLGLPPKVPVLSLSAPGLQASGSVVMNGDGTFQAARFDRVKVGDWLEGPVVLTGRGVGRGVGRSVDVAMAGGRLDMRRATFAGPGRRSGAPGNMTVALDRLVISQGIALTGFRGSFSGRGGFNGTFAAQVNGQAAVKGTVAPSAGRSAVRLQSQDAGAVFRAARVFDRAFGGVMDLTLIPTGAPGNYNGRLIVADTRIREAPALADLLGAISVIGLLEQLNGEGIVFNDVQADFLLTPAAVEVRRGSAIGSSLGVTMAGLYDLASGRMDLQGLVSPIYVLNGLGSIFTRKGEGLFGFDYSLRGTAGDPSVSVNPLSLLTPGMFRELFRREPPRLPRAVN